jgi:stage II sporulation protein AA (anti-sigma F factor antagonist)
MFELHQKVLDGPLTVRSTPYGDGVVIVSLDGELDGSTVASAATVIEAALHRPEMLVVLDLEGLHFLDSAGVALLLNLNEEKWSQGRIRVVPSRSPGVTRILAATGLDALLTIVQDGHGAPSAEQATEPRPHPEPTSPAATPLDAPAPNL